MAERVSKMEEHDRLEKIYTFFRNSHVPIRHKDMLHQVDNTGIWWDKYKIVRDTLGKGCIWGIVGPRGTGKTQMATHLCWAAANAGLPSRYVVASEMLLELRSKNKDGNQKTLGEFARKRVLVIDEIHERLNSDWEDRMLTLLLDARYRAKKDTIMVSNQTPEEFSTGVGASIKSRMNECGGILVCDWESYREQG